LAEEESAVQQLFDISSAVVRPSSVFLDSQMFRADERNAGEFECVLKIDIARNDNHRGAGV
jgi:hypothetical protein